MHGPISGASKNIQLLILLKYQKKKEGYLTFLEKFVNFESLVMMKFLITCLKQL